MYKKQMLFQKLICYLVLIGAAVIFFYSLGMMTDLYDGLRQTIPDANELDMGTPMGPKVAGARMLYDMQPFNRDVTKYSIIMLLLALFLLIMNTHGRRRYYIGNYVAIAANVIAGAYFSIVTLIELNSWKLTYLMIDFEKLKEQAELRKFPYYGPEHTFWFDSGMALMIVEVVILLLLVVNMIWKISMMNQEKKLIKGGN